MPATLAQTQWLVSRQSIVAAPDPGAGRLHTFLAWCLVQLAAHCIFRYRIYRWRRAIQDYKVLTAAASERTPSDARGSPRPTARAAQPGYPEYFAWPPACQTYSHRTERRTFV